VHLTIDVVENRIIQALAAGLPRSPRQLNGLHEADAELLDLGDGRDDLLVVKTDAVVEEIQSGLYADPDLAGWMVVMSNLSDLAAVGAAPLGVVVAAVLPAGADEPFLAALARGIGDACREAGTFLLGGDTNQGREFLLSGAAVGTVPRRWARTRLGARPGDAVYLTGPAGLGGLFALARLEGGPAVPFRPVARLREGRVVREHARCCMDTSDGVLHTLDTLMRLNGCGFLLDEPGPEQLHPLALEACRRRGLPAWLVLASVHGEFELCFTVAPTDEPAMRHAAEAAGFSPVRLGEVVAGTGVALRTGRGALALDTVAIRNLGAEAGADPGAYLRALVALGGAVEARRGEPAS
jgi:thiamine-monophosphate kinase